MRREAHTLFYKTKTEDVIRRVRVLLDIKNNAAEPTIYCPVQIASFVTIRFKDPDSPIQEWVDCSWFGPECYYLITTRVVSDGPVVECLEMDRRTCMMEKSRASSKIVAYLQEKNYNLLSRFVDVESLPPTRLFKKYPIPPRQKLPEFTEFLKRDENPRWKQTLFITHLLVQLLPFDSKILLLILLDMLPMELGATKM